VGIGTTGPGAKLVVVGNADFESDTTTSVDITTTSITDRAELRLKNSDGHNSFYRMWSADATGTEYGINRSEELVSFSTSQAGPFALGTGNAKALILGTNLTERMRVDATGNVGIGTTDPSSLLSVGANSQFQVNSSGDIVKLKNLTYSWPSSHTTNGFLQDDGSGTLSWTTIAGAGGVTGSGTANYVPLWNTSSDLTDASIYESSNNVGIGGTAPSTSPTLYVGANGNVGIGTTGPGQELEVVGDFRVSKIGDASKYMEFRTNGSGVDIQTYGNTDGFFINYATSENVTIGSGTGGSGNVNLLRNSSGNVGVGYYNNAPNKFSVAGNASITGNVGIGTTSPSSRLQVVGDEVRIGNAGTINYATGDGDLYVEDDLEVDGTIYGDLVGGITPTGFDEGPVVFGGDSGALDQDNDLWWDNSNKRLGIGTTGPETLLDLYKDSADFQIRQGDGKYSAKIGSDGSGRGFIQIWDNNATATTADAKVNFTAITGNHNWINNGNVGIGTTDPSYKLHVIGDGYFSTNLGVGGTASTNTLSLSGALLDAGGSAGSLIPLNQGIP